MATKKTGRRDSIFVCVTVIDGSSIGSKVLSRENADVHSLQEDLDSCHPVSFVKDLFFFVTSHIERLFTRCVSHLNEKNAKF